MALTPKQKSYKGLQEAILKKKKGKKKEREKICHIILEKVLIQRE